MNKAMKLLQEKCGCKADGSFGPNTARAIVNHYNLTPEEGAHLLGQAAHESGGFKRTRENLNYSWEGLMRTWPTRFKTEGEAKQYHRQPAKIARKVYLRKSLGNLTEQDAEDFIGRGYLQCTGRANYKAFASDMSVPEVLTDPSLVEEKYAFETALWFFRKNNLFKIANEGVTDNVIKRITKRVNGGYHGLLDRSEQTKKIYSWLADNKISK